jgi:hypothetical protein
MLASDLSMEASIIVDDVVDVPRCSSRFDRQEELPNSISCRETRGRRVNGFVVIRL